MRASQRFSSDGVRPGAPLWAYRNLIWNFAQRDLKARYKGTVLGWLWTLVIPLATLVTYSVVFSTIMRSSPPPMGNGDTVFALFLWSGLAPWNFFQIGLITAMGSLLGTGQLMKKIYFPSYAPVLGSLVATGIQSIIEVGILLVILACLGNIGWAWLLIPFWIVLFLIFVVGISMAMSVFNIYYRDLTHITTVALQILFYATPIIYPLSMLSSLSSQWWGPTVQALIQYNPMTVFIDVFRDASYGLTASSPQKWLALCILAAASLGIGMWASARKGRDIAEEL